MKKALLYGSALFLALFIAIYLISDMAGIGQYPANDNSSGVWLKIFSSNPANKGAEGSFMLQTGPSTANPYMVVDAKTSKDCVTCHFAPAIDFISSSHMKGSISYETLSKAKDASCLKCHDIKASDGVSSDTATLINALYPLDKREQVAGMAGITCIGCHGSADGRHYTKLNFKPEDCGTCHDKPTNCGGSNKNPLGLNIVSNFKESTHATGTIAEKFIKKATEKGLLQNYDGVDYFVTASKCLPCHQNASFQEYFAQSSYYMDADGNKHYKSYIDNNSEAFLNQNIPARIQGITLLQDNMSDAGLLCSTCHDVHSGGLTRKAVMADKDPKTDAPKQVFSAEFNLCTQCHDVKLNYTWDAENNRFDYTLNQAYYDNDEITYIKIEGGANTIIDTHFKGLTVAERKNIAGYNINAAAQRSCTGCHDQHINSKFGEGKKEGDTIKVTETWAMSGHANYKSEAFNKDDFEAECMRCHSGYEGAKVIAGIDDAKTLDNVSSMLYGTGGEPITCITCHDLTRKEIIDGKETIKLGAARSWKYDTFSFPWANEAFATPEKDIISKENLEKIGASVACYACHDGVRSGRIAETFADDDKRLSEPLNLKKMATHMGPAASITWGNAAYEFPEGTYTQGTFPQHKTNLGKRDGSFKTPEELAGEEKAYVYGCADCHDFDSVNHSGDALIEVVDPKATKPWDPKIITGINMTEQRIKLGCNEKGCHGDDGTEHAGKMQANRAAYITALEEVRTAFEKKYDLKLDFRQKTFVYASKPAEKFISWGTGDLGRKLYGAAENIALFSRMDSGAYSHNPIYTKQILWDMMDFAGGEFSKQAKGFVNNTRP